MHAFFFFPIFYLQLPFVFVTPPELLSLSATSFHPTIGIFAPRHIAQAVLQKIASARNSSDLVSTGFYPFSWQLR